MPDLQSLLINYGICEKKFEFNVSKKLYLKIQN